ncbi:MAG: hypothetical protein WDM80_06215 [Limisphaerales bacterium]
MHDLHSDNRPAAQVGVWIVTVILRLAGHPLIVVGRPVWFCKARDLCAIFVLLLIDFDGALQLALLVESFPDAQDFIPDWDEPAVAQTSTRSPNKHVINLFT